MADEDLEQTQEEQVEEEEKAPEPTLESVASDLEALAKHLNLVLPSQKKRFDALMAKAAKGQSPSVPEEVPTMATDGEAPGELRPT